MLKGLDLYMDKFLLYIALGLGRQISQCWDWQFSPFVSKRPADFMFELDWQISQYIGVELSDLIV